ncbi:exodeoxyribonuclease III [Bdellovibrio reynosensis]|uniref:Exodeoxyribonuclease III n=1 Tax=Bdellovibrio reynosensis TaxID=2835041 RepID=A0ABY4CB58_9BACT|nr:exodeoxyribonuclease III [Bdellovibrio reynosensis]UOF00748.1 exodeoxyribonuclease III [Bdellovibrio reynosensis]
MKIVSWNVNGIRACYKKGLMDFVNREKPDIFCVQETKAHIDQVEDEARKLAWEYSYWSSAIKKGYSGVATFTHVEPKAVQYHFNSIPDYESEGRIVMSDHGPFDLYNIYFPNGGSGEERHLFKQKFLKDLYAHLKEKLQTGREVVVVGDYNVAHESIDVYDPIRMSKVSGFFPEERAWFDDFVDLGFIDTFRHLKPTEAKRYSWWDYRTLARVSNRGWRIDYICISKGLEKYLSSADILDQVEGSDHCPVVATLDL